MPHYLVRVTAPPPVAERILEQPRTYLSGVRNMTEDLGGHLDGCWFTESGEQLVALPHMPHSIDNAVLREAFEQVWAGTVAEVEALLTLRELTSQTQTDDVLVRSELWRDPVDLGSDLSFPASDPPGWMNRERLAPEEAP